MGNGAKEVAKAISEGAWDPNWWIFLFSFPSCKKVLYKEQLGLQYGEQREDRESHEEQFRVVQVRMQAVNWEEKGIWNSLYFGDKNG
jgi:hypothetical protein